MAVLQIKDNVFSVGVIDWDRRLFDELIPLPHGTSYNSYLIKGSEKTALIDTVYTPKLEELVLNLKEKLQIERLDYIVANHAEPDHSGSLPAILQMYPEARVLTNAKCKELLQAHLQILDDKFITVDNSTEISLGNRTLKFMISPWVHWPDTMFTHLPEDKILFTCDFMGSHMATSDLYSVNEGAVYEAAKRYYAEIMMPFRPQVKKYTEQVKNMALNGEIDLIAPSHGPLHNRPAFIIDAYTDWASDTPKPEVVIPYVTMYESTGKMVNHLVDKLMEKGIKVTPFNLIETDLGELAVALVDAAVIVLGTSMVLAGPHPVAVYAAAITNALKPKAKYLSVIGSYGWATQLGEKMDEPIKALMPALRAEMLSPVFVKGLPGEEAFKKLDNLANEIYSKLI
ncbi:MAG: MBL fold hydrolase [Candidatus Melainabacteria bacterium GWF2_37_15]|nr:MAG: MBL fold hydrolase [Candidatus Melainabacteria bacterium GWF2_37_15]